MDVNTLVADAEERRALCEKLRPLFEQIAVEFLNAAGSDGVEAFSYIKTKVEIGENNRIPRSVVFSAIEEFDEDTEAPAVFRDQISKGLSAFYAPLSYTPPDLISYRDIAAALSYVEMALRLHLAHELKEWEPDAHH
jgi:hypothetical protein